MNGKLLLDTNIILDLLKGQESDAAFINDHAEYDLYVSVITKMELLSFHGLEKDEEDAVLKLLAAVVVIPLNEEVEGVSIRLRRATRRKLPDSIIAASAIVSEAVLVTKDRELAGVVFPGLTVCNPDSIQ